ncbi:MAG: isoprenylcysteine carboxylmethyltransferase family protein [bacterium]|nr:isoprenylcysteine carboxylmethyltransferase family protein [bacterium]
MDIGSKWVWAQFIVLLLIAVSVLVFGGDPQVGATIIALALFVAGQGIAIAAALKMRVYLTAHPAPARGAALLRDGIYGKVRHPMYGGVILMASAVSVFDLNVVAGLLTVGLVVLFFGKSRYEESLLTEAFLGYAEYQKQVTRRFIPWVL